MLWEISTYTIGKLLFLSSWGNYYEISQVGLTQPLTSVDGQKCLTSENLLASWSNVIFILTGGMAGRREAEIICALKGFNCIAVREGRASKHYLPNDLNRGSHRKGACPSPKLKSDGSINRRLHWKTLGPAWDTVLTRRADIQCPGQTVQGWEAKFSEYLFCD